MKRIAVSSARLKGFTQDLGLSGTAPSFNVTRLGFALIVSVLPDIQYSTVLAILYASYVPAQIPSNMASLRISSTSTPY